MSAAPPRRPWRFLALFALVLALSLPAWDAVSGWYLAAVVKGVNAVLALLTEPLRLPASRPPPSLYPGIAGAVALFLVTPRRGLGWKLGWLAGLLGALFALHAGLLLAATLELVRLPTADPGLVLRVGQRWGTSTLVIWVWLLALKRPAATAVASADPG